MDDIHLSFAALKNAITSMDTFTESDLNNLLAATRDEIVQLFARLLNESRMRAGGEDGALLPPNYHAQACLTSVKVAFNTGDLRIEAPKQKDATER